MNRSLPIHSAAAILLLAATACSAHEVFPVVHNEPITVRVRDGADGKPQPYAHVVLVAGYDRRDLGLGLFREEAITDAAGAVHLSNQLRNLPLVRVEVLKRHACQPDAGDAAFSVELVRRDGLNGANRCGSTTVEDAPGVLAFFVKSKEGSAPAEVSAAPLDPAPTPGPVSASSLPSAPAAPSSAPKNQLAAEPASAPALAPTPYAATSAVDPIADPAPETVSLPAPPSVITHRQASRPRHESPSGSGSDSAPSASPPPTTTPPHRPGHSAAPPAPQLQRTHAVERGHPRVSGAAAPPSADPQPHLAPAQGPGPHPMSSKPSAAHVLSPEPHLLPAARNRSAEAAPGPVPAPSLHPVPPSASAASPAPLPQSAPTEDPDDGGVDPLCVPGIE